MRKILTLLVGVIALVVFSVSILMYQINSRFNQPLNIVGSKELVIDKGQYAHFVINRLVDSGILENPLYIKAALKLEPELAQIKQGTYQLSFGMTARDLFIMLKEGKQKAFSISLVEGFTWKQWLIQMQQVDNLHYQPLSDERWRELLIDVSGNDTLLMNNLEGWLLPDTYYYHRGDSVASLVKRAHVAMLEFLEAQWPLRALDLPISSPYEALILASIIEKETGLANERARIAGVFVNRLNDNMRLQTDPTVIYGMGDTFDGNIRRKDLRTPTPYNTYVIKGLPPTPIAMPSKASIVAALNPLQTQEYYFVSRGDGSHKFSTTLREHNAAVREYQLRK